MSVEDSVRMLGAGVQSADPAEWKRMEARAAWVRETDGGVAGGDAREGRPVRQGRRVDG